tara:strand:+ start:119 stop:406 length:288 start_codon:yes stop_codon:yes gene_type:complete
MKTPDDERLKQMIESDLQELDIKCADCDKSLLNMVRSRETGQTQQLIVNCPFCDGQSWTQKLVGKYYQKAPEGLMLGGMDLKDGLYKLNMEIKNA